MPRLFQGALELLLNVWKFGIRKKEFGKRWRENSSEYTWLLNPTREILEFFGSWGSRALLPLVFPFLFWDLPKGYGELFSDTQARADGSLRDLLLPFQANIPFPASFPSRCSPLPGLGLLLMGCPARKWSGVLLWIALTWIKAVFP